jgi:hypothetical protein
MSKPVQTASLTINLSAQRQQSRTVVQKLGLYLLLISVGTVLSVAGILAFETLSPWTQLVLKRTVQVFFVGAPLLGLIQLIRDPHRY